jgi:hypothetical protein
MVYKYFFSSSAYDVFIALAIKFILKMYSWDGVYSQCTEWCVEVFQQCMRTESR